MAIELLTSNDRSIEVLPIHFDVPEHFIPLRTFVDTASHAEEIVASLNAEWFAGELEYQVVVIPPKSGSFLIGLGVAVVAITAASWKFLHSDVGRAFVRGLTGEEPAHWGEQAGKRVRECLGKKPQTDEPTTDAAVPDDERIIPLELVKNVLAVQKASTSIILVDRRGPVILVKDVSELRRVGVDPQRFQETFEARTSSISVLAAKRRTFASITALTSRIVPNRKKRLRSSSGAAGTPRRSSPRLTPPRWISPV